MAAWLFQSKCCLRSYSAEQRLYVPTLGNSVRESSACESSVVSPGGHGERYQSFRCRWGGEDAGNNASF